MAVSGVGSTNGISRYVSRGLDEAKQIIPKTQARFEKAQQNGAKAIRAVLASKDGGTLNIQV